MENLSDLIMPASIAMIMFGIGLELKIKDFQQVFLQPKAVLIGLACQLLVLPLMALAIIFFWPIDPIFKIGIMLIAACPGGTASNLVTKILKGRVALSISLTAFNSFLILFTIPLIVELSFILFGEASQSFELGFWETMKQVLFTVVIPVFAGIGINNLLSDNQSQKLHKPLKIILPLILIVTVVKVLMLDNSQHNIDYPQYFHLFVPLLILNITTILSGFFISKASKLKHESAYTIAIEMGLQNSVLALFIANQLLENRHMSLIAILYGSFSLLTTFGIAYILKEYKGSKAE